MLVLLPILLLLVTAVTLVVIAWLRPKFLYHWLVAASGAFLAWVSVWTLRIRLPHSLQLMDWSSQGLMLSSPELLVDAFSWPFALALATIVLAVILTDVLRAVDTPWQVWAGGLVITALGILAVLSANPLTLVLAWVVLDVLELAVLLLRVEAPSKQRGVILFYSTSALAIMLVLLAITLSQADHIHLTFDRISPSVALYLFLAIGLRLGIFPLQAPFLREVTEQRGLGTVIKMVLPASSLVLLVRVAQVGVPANVVNWMLLLTGLAALYGGVAWARARNEISGRRFWIVGMSALAIAAALLTQPPAALAWSMTLLYGGSFLFLFSLREKRLLPVAVLGIVSVSALPFTQAYAGLLMYSAPFHPLLLLLVAAQATLLAGFLRHALRSGEAVTFSERWLWLVYPAGLAILPLSNWLASILFAAGEPLAAPLWPLLAVLALTAGLAVLVWRKMMPSEGIFSALDYVFALRWFYRWMEQVYATFRRVVAFMNTLLEGQGGILWAFLLLTLLLSLVAQIGADPGG